MLEITSYLIPNARMETYYMWQYVLFYYKKSYHPNLYLRYNFAIWNWKELGKEGRRRSTKRVAGKNFKFVIKSRKVLITRGTSHKEEAPLFGKERGAGGRGRVKVSDVIPFFLKTIPYLNNPSLFMRTTVLSSPIWENFKNSAPPFIKGDSNNFFSAPFFQTEPLKTLV